MKALRSGLFVLISALLLALAVPASADHFLVVNDFSTTSCDTIEAALTGFGHTFDRLDGATATALTPNDIRNTYNGTFWMGSPSTGATGQSAWLVLLFNAGGNLLVADNDFGYFNNAEPLYTTYFQATYVSDSGSDGALTGQGIMAGINPDISADPYPDDFTISGADGTVIFVAPSSNAAGTSIETAVYRGIYLAWDFVYTPAADVNPIVAAIVTQLSQPLLPVELMSFSIE